MKKLFSLLLLCLTLSVFNAVYAQQPNERTVTGTVTDSKGDPVQNASVKIKGAATGTATDVNGRFSLRISGKQNVLQVSSVGFSDQEMTIGKESSVSVTLEETTRKLEEVVVVGYGTQKKKDLTGSVSSVSSDHMNLGGTTSNLGQAIQGRAAGVQVQQSDFSPGGALAIVIRGGNSIRSTNAPLYVVDGFISDYGNLISPNDIEDIQILKDASATAIYGSRGGNGVVLITTKKGKSGKVAIEGDISHGTQYLTYNPSLLNGEQYTSIMNATAIEDGNPPPFPSSFPVTNTHWFDVATQNASIDNRSISVSGSDKTSKIYLSGNYIKQIGVLKHTGMERYSARIGAEKSLSDRIKIGANFYGANTSTDLQTYTGDITAPLFSILTAQPNIPVYNADGTYYKYLGKNNALANLIEPTNTSVTKLVNGNMYVDYSLLKNLTYHISAGAEYNQVTNGQYVPVTLVAGLASKGIAQEVMQNSFRWLVEHYLTYKYESGAHSLTALIGNSNQKDIFEKLGAGSKGFPTDLFLYYNLSAGSLPVAPVNGKVESKLTDYFGRLNYSYNDKILATFTLRDDASSRFGANNRHGLFPSAAVAWRMTDEPFIQHLNTFSSLKARVSYGVTGNDRIGDYAYLTTFSNYSTVLYPGGPLQVGIEPSALSNNNLKWESTAQFDVGLDMAFAQGRIGATIDYYSKKTNDLLIAIPIGQWWGFSNQVVNAGSISNRGIELSINSQNVSTKDFIWNTTFNIAYNRQKVDALSNNVQIISTNTANPSGVVSGQEFTRLVVGKELGEIFGYKYAGVIKTGETYAPQPLSKAGDPKYADLDGDGAITPADRTYLGNTNPRYTAGFSNDFRYRGFSLTVFFQGAFGYNLYNMNRLVLESTTGTDALNRWVAKTNENTDIPREGYFLSKYGSYVNSRFVEDASYVRLKQVSLSYNVPIKLIKAIKFIDAINIYASAQNLLTITKYTGTDPEVNVHAINDVNIPINSSNIFTAPVNNVGGGLDFGVFPAFRTFTFGARIAIH